MALTGTRTYVGFGFGAIQGGLFLYEAFCSGAFRRLVVAEVLPEVVTTVRRGGGYYTVNIAHADRVERATVGPIEIYDPAVKTDRAQLVAALAEAAEIGTAVPSVADYTTEGEASLHRLLARGLREKGLRGGTHAIVYAAENHNHAAEILQAHVLSELAPHEQEAVAARVRFLNTVIGKMSRVVTDPAEIHAAALAPVTPEATRAFLVEAFNRILISRLRFNGVPFARGITVFEEKDDLLPFEEAKLYGHNATHALAAYLGARCGVQFMFALKALPGMMDFLRAAFMEESGQALIRKYRGLDPLFTPAGYAAYADDLLERMTNPYLRDTVARVARDPARKLGWNDRLIGTMRLALAQGIEPWRYALGAAAALAMLEPKILETERSLEEVLLPLWRDTETRADERRRVLDLLEQARHRLRRFSRTNDIRNLYA